MSSQSLSPIDDLSDFDFEFDDSASFATYPSSTTSVTSSFVHRLYRSDHGRTYLTLNKSYMCPVDEEARQLEVLFQDLKLVVFGAPYPQQVSPMINRVLLQQPEGKQARVLDVGCGSLAVWMIDMAKRFPNVEVTGLDLGAKRYTLTPPNCVYEIFDVAEGGIPYPKKHFQFIHHSFLSWWCTKSFPYPRLVEEIAGCLEPGGVYFCVEPSCELWTESGEPLVLRFPALAAFQKIHRDALMSGEIIHPSTLDQTEVVKASGYFSRCFSETIDIQLGSRSSKGVHPSINLAGMNFLEMWSYFYRAWMPLLNGQTDEQADLITDAVQRELDGLEQVEAGRGVKGKIFILFAVRGSKEAGGRRKSR